VRITADTNVLVRALTNDDPPQAAVARRALAKAEKVVVTLPTLCELVWVLSQGYKIPTPAIADAIGRLIDSETVHVNRPPVLLGLAVLQAGGDFADAVIAHEGRWMGADTFVSFDRRAVAILERHGEAATLLSP